MATLHAITFDCARAPAQAQFWAQVLDGYQVRPYDDAEIERLAGLGLTPDTDPSVAVDGPGPTLLFIQVPEPKATKNRVHLDAVATDRATEVIRLVTLGSSVRQEFDTWTVMQDPEGNEFCITDAR